MSFESKVVKNAQTVEYGKFLEIVNDTRFPAISVTRYLYKDQSNAFPENQGLPPLTSVEIYPKFAVLTHDIASGQPNYSPFGDNSSSDAFGRLRVSNPITLLDAKQLYGKSPALFDEVVNGTATSTQSAGDACVYMRTLASGDYVIRQTRQNFNYQPGKSLQALMTGVFSTQTNVIKRVGLFSGSYNPPYNPIDGIYLENNSGKLTLNIIKTEGTPSTESVPQSAWNVDKLDGSGPSGITLNLSKTQIFVIDYEWLGVGRVRTGFVIDGKFYYAHYFNHANIFSTAYMTNPNQHIRYEIRQSGAGSGEMQHICSTAMTEGGEDEVGSPFSVDTGGQINSYDTTLRPLFAMRRNRNYSNLVITLQEIDLIASNTNAKFGIYLNPSIGGGTLNYNLSSNGIEYALGSNSLTMSGGTLIYQGNILKDVSSGVIKLSSKCRSFGESINGIQDEFIVGIKTYSGSNGNFGLIANLLERG